MMFIDQIVFVIFAAVLVVIFWRRRRKGHSIEDLSRRAPAVPGALPWFGNALSVDRQQPHVTLTAWHAMFGPIYRLAYHTEVL